MFAYKLVGSIPSLFQIKLRVGLIIFIEKYNKLRTSIEIFIKVFSFKIIHLARSSILSDVQSLLSYTLSMFLKHKRFFRLHSKKETMTT